MCIRDRDSTCKNLFSVIPKLKEFFKTFDFGKIMEIFGELYQAIFGFVKQFEDCQYIQSLGKFFANIIDFFSNFSENLKKIRLDLTGFINCLSEERYFDAGIFLGNIFKTIIGE
eukprot:TRINITY_DN1694_c0_g2_i1.p1 TRINITY_DN1694_c0_g2~~TRINITY_DN1694_c0_g2_i1.p1  ORF type:complete len:114 (+),score=49.82 TRINITY_DN1694_c0_g2_i1:61-402(+)